MLSGARREAAARGAPALASVCRSVNDERDGGTRATAAAAGGLNGDKETGISDAVSLYTADVWTEDHAGCTSTQAQIAV